jgi:hypothetical protein
VRPRPHAGSWRGLGEELRLLADVQPGELRDAAEALFAPSNCFAGYVARAV